MKKFWLRTCRDRVSRPYQIKRCPQERHNITLYLINPSLHQNSVNIRLKDDKAQVSQKIRNSNNHQKQPFSGVFRKRCSENMHQFYRRITMPKCDFNKIGSHTSAWVFSYEFNVYTLFFYIRTSKFCLRMAVLSFFFIFEAEMFLVCSYL